MTQEQEQSPLPGVGPELDRLVAAKMGFEWEPFESGSGPSGEWVIPGTNRTAYDVRWIHRTGLFQPQYSTSIEAAWEVVEANNLAVLPTLDGKWFCGKLDLKYFHMSDFYAPERGYIEHGFKYFEIADTAPHAICLAFLALPDFEVTE